MTLHGSTQQVLVAGHASRVARKEMLNLRTGQGRPDRRQEGQVARKGRLSHLFSYRMRNFSDDPGRKRQKLLRVASIRERINSIRPGLTGGGPRLIDGTIIFPPIDPTRTLQHIPTHYPVLEIGDFDVRRILVDPGSSTDLVQASVVGRMGHSLTSLENPGRILSGFNGSSTTSLGDIILTVQAGPVISTYNFRWYKFVALQCHLGAHMATLHESHPLTYHQMVDKDPSAADPLQTIQISEEGTHLTNISSLLAPEETQNASALRQNYDIFAWAHSDMKGIDPSITP
ncbi:hypothetical protein CK203_070407 [Vitis vinifera]|uniref:Uncharacterized protein n=1 Tax=Vitis vinifera TaxID=29760 RepID=A0A438E6U6_VITVI|nr:hypothetical protein CK203_070407 [Vitis vinifera]